eukprot:SAG11_NODE_25982_length_351_cov_0.821429_1_plen_78_part_10
MAPSPTDSPLLQTLLSYRHPLLQTLLRPPPTCSTPRQLAWILVAACLLARRTIVRELCGCHRRRTAAARRRSSPAASA